MTYLNELSRAISGACPLAIRHGNTFVDFHVINILPGGENENKFGLIHFFDTEIVRDKYWPKKDVPSELANALFEKLVPVRDKLRKLGTFSTVRTDWIVKQ